MGLFHAPFLRWCRLNVPDFPTQGTAAVMLAQSRRTRPCGFPSATAAVMLAQSRRTRPRGFPSATAAVMLTQSRRTRPCGFPSATAAVMLALSRRTRPCGFPSATATVMQELHPTAPSLPLPCCHSQRKHHGRTEGPQLTIIGTRTKNTKRRIRKRW